MNPRTNPWAAPCAFALGAAWVFLGSLKILDPRGLSLYIAHVTGTAHAATAAQIVAWSEFGLGFLLIMLSAIGWPRPMRAAVALSLVISSVCAIDALRAHGAPVDCGCFGNLFRVTHAGRLLASGALVLASLWSLRACGTRLSRRELRGG